MRILLSPRIFVGIHLPRNWKIGISMQAACVVRISHMEGQDIRTQEKYSPEIKAKIVLEAIQGEKTTEQLCQEYEIAPHTLEYWKNTLTEHAPLLFKGGRPMEEPVYIAELDYLEG